VPVFIEANLTSEFMSAGWLASDIGSQQSGQKTRYYHVLHPLHHTWRVTREEFLLLRPVNLTIRNMTKYLRHVYPRYTPDLKPVDLSSYSDNVVVNLWDKDDDGTESFETLRHDDYDSHNDGLRYAIRLATSSSKFRFEFGHRVGEDTLADCVAHLYRSIGDHQDIWRLPALGRVLSVLLNPGWWNIEIIAAAGTRDILLWPGSKEVFDGDSLITRLGL
jgi:hypothetical protein